MKRLTLKSMVAALAAWGWLGAAAAVTPGEWNTNFTDSLAYAEANDVPIVVVWGNTSCGYCKKLHAVLEDDAIMDWAAEHPIMMVTKHEKYGSTDADYVAAKAWIKGLNSSISGFPYVGVYWKKSNGTVACSTAFEGRSGAMPVTKGTLAEQFAGSLDKLVGDYPDGGSVANAPKNPHWVGEYTAATLPYGEWTMDFDVAKQKVATYGGKLVAMFGGPLWCPNCVAIEDDVFATSTFKAWAKQEKLVLVHFDQGQASSPATAAGTAKGRLLTTVPASNTGESGEEYLARHNIDPNSSTVKSVIDRVTELTAQWLAPESTAARLGNPTVLLLNSAGTAVDARFLRQKATTGYDMDLDENMCRLEDLISLKGDNEKKGYCTTTPLSLRPGESDAVEYHICSRKIAYRLKGLKAGDYVTATVSSTDDDAQDVYVSLVTADGTELVCAKKCAALTTPLTAEQAAELYLMTAAYGKDNSDVQGAFFGDATSFKATVSVEAGEEKPEQWVSFKSLTKAEQKELNEELYQKQSVTVPIYKPVALGGKCLVGTLAVSVTAANKISAKYAGEKTISFSGTWDEIDQTSGEVRTELVKSGYELTLSMDAKGGFEAGLGPDTSAVWGSGASAAGDVSAYAGSYTVTLADVDGEVGTAYLTMKITTKGKATVSGVMPDGTTVSASVALSPNADGTAIVPIYKKASKGVLSVALAVKPDADETWGKEGSDVATVSAATGCFAWWNGTATGETQFNVYGGFWKSTTPLAICDNYGLSDELNVVIGGATNDAVIATSRGFTVVKPAAVLTSLSFTKSTGVFSGKAKVAPTAGAKAVTATIKGVLLPGWISCGECGEETGVARPYGSGTIYYKVGKTTVSLPINLVAEGE